MSFPTHRLGIAGVVLSAVLGAAGDAHAQVASLVRANGTASSRGRTHYHISPRTQPGSGWVTAPRTQPGGGWNGGAGAFDFGRGTVYPDSQGTAAGGQPLRNSYSAPGSGWNSASAWTGGSWYYPGGSTSSAYPGNSAYGGYAAGSTYGASSPQSGYSSATQFVLLKNPASTGTTVHYRIAGNEYQMPPGHEQWISTNSTWVIDFHRGGPYGRKQYTLEGGTYQFTPTQQGWELFQVQ